MDKGLRKNNEYKQIFWQTTQFYNSVTIFRSHGQGYMYVQHADNLLTLLRKQSIVIRQQVKKTFRPGTLL